jgi:hypothetical protein
VDNVDNGPGGYYVERLSISKLSGNEVYYTA